MMSFNDLDGKEAYGDDHYFDDNSVNNKDNDDDDDDIDADENDTEMMLKMLMLKL